jgi:hypothetical protein
MRIPAQQQNWLWIGGGVLVLVLALPWLAKLAGKAPFSAIDGALDGASDGFTDLLAKVLPPDMWVPEVVGLPENKLADAAYIQDLKNRYGVVGSVSGNFWPDFDKAKMQYGTERPTYEQVNAVRLRRLGAG